MEVITTFCCVMVVQALNKTIVIGRTAGLALISFRKYDELFNVRGNYDLDHSISV